MKKIILGSLLLINQNVYGATCYYGACSNYASNDASSCTASLQSTTLTEGNVCVAYEYDCGNDENPSSFCPQPDIDAHTKKLFFSTVDSATCGYMQTLYTNQYFNTMCCNSDSCNNAADFNAFKLTVTAKPTTAPITCYSGNCLPLTSSGEVTTCQSSLTGSAVDPSTTACVGYELVCTEESVTSGCTASDVTAGNKRTVFAAVPNSACAYLLDPNTASLFPGAVCCSTSNCNSASLVKQSKDNYTPMPTAKPNTPKPTLNPTTFKPTTKAPSKNPTTGHPTTGSGFQCYYGRCPLLSKTSSQSDITACQASLTPMSAAGYVCVSYIFTCAQGDSACTAEEITNQVKKTSFVFVSYDTCVTMTSSIYSNIYQGAICCDSASNCNSASTFVTHLQSITSKPTTAAPTTPAPTEKPSTLRPTTKAPTNVPTAKPTTPAPTTKTPTNVPTAPTNPTSSPTTKIPTTAAPTTKAPTSATATPGPEKCYAGTCSLLSNDQSINACQSKLIEVDASSTSSSSDPTVCVSYIFTCRNGDNACTSSEISSSAKKASFTIVSNSTCTTMKSQPSVYQFATCCSTTRCNTAKAFALSALDSTVTGNAFNTQSSILTILFTLLVALGLSFF